MSVDLDRQLREYCRDMDEKQGALSFEDVLERTGELQVISGRRPQQPLPRRRWIVVAAAALAVLLVVVGIRFLPGTDDTPDPADQPTPTSIATPTTAAPGLGGMTDLEVIEAGIEALYSGDADRAVELFEMADLYDDASLRDMAALEAAIDGRMTLDCTERDTSGVFDCIAPYQNAFTDAIGWVDSPRYATYVAVENGVITTFRFSEHTFLLLGLEQFLAETGYSQPACVWERSIECANYLMDHLDEWAVWAETNLELPAADPDADLPPEVIRGWPDTTENAAGLYSWGARSCDLTSGSCFNGFVCAGGSCNVGFMHNGYGSGDVDITIDTLPQGDVTDDNATAVTVAGHDGIHRRIDEHQEEWIADIEGTTIVIRLTTEPGTSEADLDEAHAIIDSIRTEPRDNAFGFRLVFTLTTDDWDSG